MSMIEKQINDLELLRGSLLLRDNHTARNTVCDAIDTIKALSAKLQEQNLHGRHIPKKPILDDSFLDNVLECPSCKHHFGIKGLMPETKGNYCPNCGQRIDWN